MSSRASVISQSRSAVRYVKVEERSAGQRLDNFLLRECPGVPKTRLYRAIRKGEIRIDRGRARQDTRLQVGQTVRIPPLAVADRPDSVAPSHWQQRLLERILYEDDDLLVINKPPGLAVHGGSGLSFGLIETMRELRPNCRVLELAHRLDRETSGVLVLAKRVNALRQLHELFRNRSEVSKTYLALVHGHWPRAVSSMTAPLQRVERKSGERIVVVNRAGKPSQTSFTAKKRYAASTLIEAKPVTGRTHQIRVHAAFAGHPLLGDDKYGNDDSNALTIQLELKRLFLHAAKLSFTLHERVMEFEAPLDCELQRVLSKA
ncbi:MAG: RluA family pseudouridine synthase [Pseudomonadota bacterium]